MTFKASKLTKTFVKIHEIQEKMISTAQTMFIPATQAPGTQFLLQPVINQLTGQSQLMQVSYTG